jgi:hypothetical protein
MNIDYVITAIQKGTIKLEEIAEAKEMLDNEIMQCQAVIQDPETELYSRREFQAKLVLYQKLKNRL